MTAPVLCFVKTRGTVVREGKRRGVRAIRPEQQDRAQREEPHAPAELIRTRGCGEGSRARQGHRVGNDVPHGLVALDAGGDTAHGRATVVARRRSAHSRRIGGELPGEIRVGHAGQPRRAERHAAFAIDAVAGGTRRVRGLAGLAITADRRRHLYFRHGADIGRQPPDRRVVQHGCDGDHLRPEGIAGAGASTPVAEIRELATKVLGVEAGDARRAKFGIALREYTVASLADVELGRTRRGDGGVHTARGGQP